MSDLNSITANARVKSPTVRKIVGRIFGWTAVVILGAGIVDQAVGEFDISAELGTASTITLGLFGLWQLIVTDPNVPTAPAVSRDQILADFARLDPDEQNTDIQAAVARTKL